MRCTCSTKISSARPNAWPRSIEIPKSRPGQPHFLPAPVKGLPSNSNVTPSPCCPSHPSQTRASRGRRTPSLDVAKLRRRAHISITRRFVRAQGEEAFPFVALMRFSFVRDRQIGSVVIGSLGRLDGCYTVECCCTVVSRSTLCLCGYLIRYRQRLRASARCPNRQGARGGAVCSP